MGKWSTGENFRIHGARIKYPHILFYALTALLRECSGLKKAIELNCRTPLHPETIDLPCMQHFYIFQYLACYQSKTN